MNAKLIFTLTVVMAAVVWTSCNSNNNKLAANNKNTKPETSVDTAKYAKLSPFTYSIGGKITSKQAQKYDLIVVEPSSYNKSQIAALKKTGATVLAYLSVGEVGPYRYYFKEIKKRGFLGKNKNWNAYYINLADSVTYNLFFTTIIPKIMKKDFDGLFLDTVDDVAPYTSRSNLQPYMVKLIKQIHSNYPDIMIIQNDGLFLLNKTSKIVSAVLKEDIATHYNFETKSYRLRDKKSYRSVIQKINRLSKKYHMPFLLVDYAVSDSLRHLAEARLDTLPYPYYIGDIGLDNVANAVTGNNY
jgi:uncharacterized protein (TIGR01370 family)